MREIEEEIFQSGMSAESLMEEAGREIAGAVGQFYPEAGHCVVYAGKGNNAGDAFVAARELRKAGWVLHVREGFPRAKWSALAVKKRLELGSEVALLEEMPRRLRGPVVVLDGLLGLGASLPLREPVAQLCQEVRELRRQGGCVVAVDMPTGLDADSGEVDEQAVVADVTVTLGLPKAGLFNDAASAHVGRIVVGNMPGAEEVAAKLGDESDGSFEMPVSHELRRLLPVRRLDCHKGDCGRLAILAGSPGFTGAAMMTSLCAVRAGAGLVTLFAMREVYATLAAAAPPEVMVTPVNSPAEVALDGFDALVAGPGLGRQHDEAVLSVITQFPGPCVVDADALNALAARTSILDDCKWPRLLTPHPGEMARLTRTEGMARWEIAADFSALHPTCTLLLKGPRTLITTYGQPLSAVQTGSPALASGGTGDCLAGICGALLAQGLNAFDAARLGAWLHGRAAEIALACGGQSVESLAATDLATHLGAAFRSLRNCDF